MTPDFKYFAKEKGLNAEVLADCYDHLRESDKNSSPRDSLHNLDSISSIGSRLNSAIELARGEKACEGAAWATRMAKKLPHDFTQVVAVATEKAPDRTTSVSTRASVPGIVPL